jgi:DNA-binding transcriptional MerR regulator
MKVEVSFTSRTIRTMDISEVAKRSGVAASALRYYERKGLIHALQSEGARRKFAPAVLDQLALIALGQAAGFSLDEIRVMLTPNGEPDIDRAMFQKLLKAAASGALESRQRQLAPSKRR